MTRLSGRIALVTGAAVGMGAAAARRLAADGARVWLLDRQPCELTLADIRRLGGSAEVLQADITDEAALARAAQAIEADTGRLDILVNNAGILSGRKPWHEHTLAEVKRFLEVNAVGPFGVTQAMHALLLKSSAGRVINVASRTYFLANPGQIGYVMSKGAVMGFTRVLAKELGVHGITVNAVAPGMISTPGTSEHSPEEAFDRVAQNQAIRRRGQPEDLAGLIAFLASDDAAMITGQFMLADGGGYLL